MIQEKEEEVLLEYLGKLYRKYAERKNPIRQGVQEKETRYIYNDIVKDIEQILKQLPSAYAKVIYFEFLVMENVNWWQNTYDKTVYLELKNMAIRAFFHCLYV